ncbi:hypothetical protein H257_13637 [Aphanomyces astaci]|uniref:Cyclic nucleotide-binding domain-containing protein n=2 Tax=Aphanomyces astaci TaxID=112090 RepID=W4FTR8_APHAT|nr:hypothetical protein H257_13637 [Aphanomyces astaci]ETV70857.1 hypothetical protein H257_13637 [Aphanomyces astaci]|eukprot:XP_009839520.1 hypothetical protein H257_13637 [Aphanomyces astaci]
MPSSSTQVLGPAWFADVKSATAGPPSKKKVDFDRSEFVRQVKAAIESTGKVNDPGFVREVKRRRDFAIDLVQAYPHFSEAQSLQLLLGLAVDLGSQDMSLLVRSLPSMLRAHLVFQVLAAALGFNPPTDLETYKHVKRGLVPLPEQFFLLIGSVPSGYSFVLQLRSDLASCVKKFRDALSDHELHALSFLDKLMRDLFATQTGVHFRRIELKPDNREVLRVIVQNERVHAMRSFDDLARRLNGPRRQVFGVFHSNISHLPLVIVETFFTTYMPTAIDAILEPSPVHHATDMDAASLHRPPPTSSQEADTHTHHHAHDDDDSLPTHGVFYSISNMHVGLRGLNLASHLLFLTITHCSKLYPSIHTWVTLSPVPTFRAWLHAQLVAGTASLSSDTLQTIEQEFGVNRFAAPKWLLAQLDTHNTSPRFTALARRVLVRLCATYVCFARQVATHKIIDPVANFHLQNGAQVESVNFHADTADRGVSFGVMINYKYSMHLATDNTSISYQRDSTVAVSPSVMPLLINMSPPHHHHHPFLQAIQDLDHNKKHDIHVLATQFAKGTTILRRGQLPDAVYFICLGQVRVDTVPSSILAQGQSFGDAEVVNGEPVRFSVVAMSVCHVLFVRHKDMVTLLDLVPSLRPAAPPTRIDSRL